MASPVAANAVRVIVSTGCGPRWRAADAPRGSASGPRRSAGRRPARRPGRAARRTARRPQLLGRDVGVGRRQPVVEHREGTPSVVRSRTIASSSVSAGRSSAAAARASTGAPEVEHRRRGDRPARTRSSCRLVSTARRWTLRLATVVPMPRRRTSRPWSTISCIARRTVGRESDSRAASASSFSKGSPGWSRPSCDRRGELLAQLVPQRHGRRAVDAHVHQPGCHGTGLYSAGRCRCQYVVTKEVSDEESVSRRGAGRIGAFHAATLGLARRRRRGRRRRRRPRARAAGGGRHGRPRAVPRRRPRRPRASTRSSSPPRPPGTRPSCGRGSPPASRRSARSRSPRPSPRPSTWSGVVGGVRRGGARRLPAPLRRRLPPGAGCRALRGARVRAHPARHHQRPAPPDAGYMPDLAAGSSATARSTTATSCGSSPAARSSASTRRAGTRGAASSARPATSTPAPRCSPSTTARSPCSRRPATTGRATTCGSRCTGREGSVAVGLDHSLALRSAEDGVDVPRRAGRTTRSWTASSRPTGPSSRTSSTSPAARTQPVHGARRPRGLPGRRGLHRLARTRAPRRAVRDPHDVRRTSA